MVVIISCNIVTGVAAADYNGFFPLVSGSFLGLREVGGVDEAVPLKGVEAGDIGGEMRLARVACCEDYVVGTEGSCVNC